jgi:hypothetical protein
MAEVKFDRPELGTPDVEDDATLAAIEEGIEQLDAGAGIPIQELREELRNRCSK